MRERPILFSAPMVCAVLEGRKTQTRRVIALPHWTVADDLLYMDEEDPPWPHAISAYSGCMARVECPYGIPSDRLWVRETWGIADRGGRLIDPCINYRADGGQLPLIGHADPKTWSMARSTHEVNDADLLKVKDGWRSARFMFRWASRITLEITEVRVQRVQEISADECAAEGSQYPVTTKDCPRGKCAPLLGISGKFPACRYLEKKDKDVHRAYSCAYFASLWDSINAKRGHGWDVNPWVWAITFKRLA